MHPRSRLRPVLLAALLLGPAAPAPANPPLPGEPSYRLYCAGCHGADARGGVLMDGPAGARADLTRLAERYGEPLPLPLLLERVGRRTPASPWFENDMSACATHLLPTQSTAGLRAGRRGTVLAILRYLEGLQRGGPVPRPLVRAGP